MSFLNKGIYFLCFSLFLLVAFSVILGKSNIAIHYLWSDGAQHSLLKDIVIYHRVPRLLSAIFTGISLSLSGWVLQEYFRNPLAGPSVLGVSSFAGLGVAIAIVSGSVLGVVQWVHSPVVLIISALVGGFVSTLVLIIIAKKIKSTTALIIVGFMFSALAGALISILQFYAENQSLKSYIVWSFGSLNGLNYTQLLYYFTSLLLGFVLVYRLVPHLEKMQLGELYAQSMGVHLGQMRFGVVLSAALLTSVSVALVGPIAFVGLAVPHICRTYLKTGNFKKLFWYNVLIGSNLMLIFSLVAELFPLGVLPVNVISALLGVPVVLSIVIRQKSLG